MTSKQKLDLVKKIAEKWKPRLNLSSWDITISLEDNDEKSCTGMVTAECTSKTMYENAHVTVFPYFFKMTKPEQEKCIVHELAHCMTEPYKDLYRKYLNFELVTSSQEREVNEKLTTGITSIIFDSYK